MTLFSLRNWPEFSNENFVSAGKPNNQTMKLKIRGNFESSEAAMEGSTQTQLLPILPALSLAESMSFLRIYPWLVLNT